MIVPGGIASFKKSSSTPVNSETPIIGTLQSLEKPYFRLTSSPDPSQIRPEKVLLKSLELMKRRWERK
jgi:hypothetical protein